MFKAILAGSLIALLICVGFAYYPDPYPQATERADAKADQLVDQKVELEIVKKTDSMPENCPMNHSNGSDKAVVSSMDKAVSQQEQQPQEPEGDKHCERPDPKGNPDVGGVDPKKIGCSCARTCGENGKPTENYAEGKTCKVHCKPDNCDCPNPCVKT